MRLTGVVVGLLSACALVTALPEPDHSQLEERDGVLYNVFKDFDTGAEMRFVKNSGVCETTPGVEQMSGYLTVGLNQHMCMINPIVTTQLLRC